MRVYLAGDIPWYTQGIYNEVINAGNVSMLQSFVDANRGMEELIPKLESFMLDSGAFTFLNNCKSNVDWNAYIEKYADFINRNNVELFFELDIDAIVGYERVLELRKKLESLTGKQSIPVWHRSRGKAEYLRHCSEYSYVAIGGIAIKEIKPSEYNVFPYLIEEAHKRGAKVHGLGFTHTDKLRKYRFDSVDSSTWTVSARFGRVFKFSGTGIDTYSSPENCRVDGKKAAVDSFKEWVKFQQYAKLNL